MEKPKAVDITRDKASGKFKGASSNGATKREKTEAARQLQSAKARPKNGSHAPPGSLASTGAERIKAMFERMAERRVGGGNLPIDLPREFFYQETE